MTRRQHSELVAANADLILADKPSIEAFAAYFEAQIPRGKARRLLCSSYRWLARALWRY
jgi:hypothetical protein